MASATEEPTVLGGRLALDALDLRDSLSDFTRAAWPLVEPGKRYIPNWHIDVIAEHLEAITAGELQRLIINIPPRHMKSLSVAVFWPCWEWLTHPERRYLFTSYGQDLSKRDSRKCRRLISHPGMPHAGPEANVLERVGYFGVVDALASLDGEETWRLTGDQSTQMRFENSRMGYRIASSPGGMATGEGGDRVVVDDPHKTDEAKSEVTRESVTTWWNETMASRLNDPKTGAFVVVMQRLHEEDLTGILLEQGGYEHLCLPAEYEPDHPFVWPRDPRTEPGDLLWPDRIDADAITELKRMGAYAAAGQLQQRPAPAEGLMFKTQHFRYWHRQEEGDLYVLERDEGPQPFARIECAHYMTVDVAASEKQTADYTVAALWAVTRERDLLLVDRKRERFEALDVGGMVERAYREWGEPGTIGVEDFGFGLVVIQELVRKGLPIMRLRPDKEKVARAMVAVARYEEHRVFHPRGFEWVKAEWEPELLTFNAGAHDDQVDVVAYAARHLPNVTIGRNRRRERRKGEMAGVRTREF